MEIDNLALEINSYIEDGNAEAVKNSLGGLHPSQIASIIQNVSSENQSFILDSLGPEITLNWTASSVKR